MNNKTAKALRKQARQLSPDFPAEAFEKDTKGTVFVSSKSVRGTYRRLKREAKNG